MSNPPTLTDAMKELLNGALGRGKPVAVSYVDENQQPHLSYRGTVQTFGEGQLALWARDPKDGIAAALAHNPSIVLLYGDFTSESRAFLSIRGKGHVVNDETVRKTVFENAHPLEQERDKDRKGVAIVVDLDSVSGLLNGGFVKLARE